MKFYEEHKGKPFYEKLVAFMTSGPIWAAVLAKKDAIRQWRALMGPTNSCVAKETDPSRCFYLNLTFTIDFLKY